MKVCGALYSGCQFFMPTALLKRVNGGKLVYYSV